MRRDEAYLLDIHLAARKIQRFVAGMTYAEFVADEKTQSAVIRELILIGEASAKTSMAGQAAHPAIPWHELTDLRNFYVHVYHKIIYPRLWEAATALIPDVEKLTITIFPDKDEQI